MARLFVKRPDPSLSDTFLTDYFAPVLTGWVLAELGQGQFGFARFALFRFH